MSPIIELISFESKVVVSSMRRLVLLLGAELQLARWFLQFARSWTFPAGWSFLRIWVIVSCEHLWRGERRHWSIWRMAHPVLLEAPFRRRAHVLLARQSKGHHWRPHRADHMRLWLVRWLVFSPFISLSLRMDHVDQDLFCIVQSLVEAGILGLKVTIERCCSNLTSWGDEDDSARSWAEDELWRVLEYDLYDLVTKSEEDSLLGSFPLLDKDLPIIFSWCFSLFRRLKLLAIEIALKVLHKNDLLLDLRRIVLECIVVGQLLKRSLRFTVLSSYVDEVEAVLVQHHLGAVIEQDHVTTIGKLASDPILWTVIYPFGKENLAWTLNAKSRGVLDFDTVLLLVRFSWFAPRLFISWSHGLWH